jgi:REP element-mobilizing transposase RayT
MPYDPNVHHRRSIRLPNYDYSQPGAYFITICVQNHACLFGKIHITQNGAELELNVRGKMIHNIWQEMPFYNPGLVLDQFILMPNHLHGIMVLDASAQRNDLSLPGIVRTFKAISTKRYAEGVKKYGWPRFPGRLWQRNYWERIIRNEKELHAVREYIYCNPAKWEDDPLFIRR